MFQQDPPFGSNQKSQIICLCCHETYEIPNLSQEK